MYINPFWIGLAAGIIVGVVTVFTWAFIIREKRNKKDGNSENDEH